MILLSICIATLNRATFIGETLDSVISQITPEVEIVVVDGASTDNTREVVNEYASRCDNLRYIQLSEKGGLDQDYCKAVKFARGEYCWLFTDDDLLKPGAIAVVLAAARRQYSLIVVNAEVRTTDLTVCLEARRMHLDHDRVYPPSLPERHWLLADAGDYLSFIGGVVIKRTIWSQRELVKYYGTAFIHMGVVFQSPMPGDALILAHPWIVIRWGNAQWVARSFEIWMFQWPKLVWSFPDYPDWAKNQVIACEPWRSLPRLLVNRAKGHYSVREYHEFLKPRVSSPWPRMIFYAIAIAPIAFLNWLARFRMRWILHKTLCITFFDLQAWSHKSKQAASNVRS
jgi:glycosyltransferase involved in cell wall biosynthesis